MIEEVKTERDKYKKLWDKIKSSIPSGKNCKDCVYVNTFGECYMFGGLKWVYKIGEHKHKDCIEIFGGE